MVRRVLVVAGEVLGLTKSNFGLLFSPILLDGLEVNASLSFAVSPVDLSLSGEMIVVFVVLRVVVERLVLVNVVNLLVVERLVVSVDVDIIVDVVVGVDAVVGFAVGRRLVGLVVVVTILTTFTSIILFYFKRKNL